MNRSIILAAVAGGALAAQAALAQNLLAQAERTPPLGAAAASELAPAADAPRGGYLGFVPDDRHTGRGVRIESVKAGAPAAQGGLKDGDLITAVDGKLVANLAQFDEILDGTSPGQRMQMTVDRGGRSQQIMVTLGTRSGAPPAAEPAPSAPGLSPPGAPSGATAPSTGSFSAPSLTTPSDPAPPDAAAPSLSSPATSESLPGPSVAAPPAAAEINPRSIRAQPLETGPAPGDAASRPGPSASSGGAGGRASLGISVDAVTEEARSQAGAPSRRGAFIASVRRGSPAEQAGLPTGGVIVELDGRELMSDDDLVAAIKAAEPGQEVTLSYFDRGRQYRKVVRLAGAGEGAASIASEPNRGERNLRGAPGGPGNRPLLRNLGQMAADTIGRPGGLSTVYDPSVVAALQTRVAELTAQTQQLEERIRQLESKLGSAPAAAPAMSSPALTPAGSTLPAGPSFGAPTGPGFGPAIGGPGTTP